MQNPRLRLVGAITALLACFALTACDDINKTGYSNAQKARIAALVRPQAVKLATQALKLDTPTLSDDGKTFLLDVGSSKADSVTMFVEIRKTGPRPDPAQVISIDLDHWVTDPTKPGDTTQDYTLGIDSMGDHINTDAYWYVDSMVYQKPGSHNMSDEIFINNLPRHTDSGKMDMSSILDTTKLIMSDIKSLYEPYLPHVK